MEKHRRDDGSATEPEWRDHEMRASVERWLAQDRGAMLSASRRFEATTNGADDVVQGASMVAMSLLEKVRAAELADGQDGCAASAASPREWLIAITRCVALRVWRKPKPRARHDQPVKTDRPGWFGEDPAANWPADAFLGELKDRVRDASKRLPYKQRKVVLAIRRHG